MLVNAYITQYASTRHRNDRQKAHTQHARINQCVNMKILQCYGHKGDTDREVTEKRPNIIIKNKREKTCLLIDVAKAAERNITQKEA